MTFLDVLFEYWVLTLLLIRLLGPAGFKWFLSIYSFGSQIVDNNKPTLIIASTLKALTEGQLCH